MKVLKESTCTWSDDAGKQIYNSLFTNERIHTERAHALALALSKVEENPDSAHDAYWLARSYRLHRDRVAALAQVKRAFELKPGNSKYRSADYSLRRQVPTAQSEDEEGEQAPPG